MKKTNTFYRIFFSGGVFFLILTLAGCEIITGLKSELLISPRRQPSESVSRNTESSKESNGSTPVEKKSSISNANLKQEARDRELGESDNSSRVSRDSSHNILYKSQQRLAERGYLTGTADGVMGLQTKEAIKLFQKDNGLAVTGRLDRDTLTALGE